MFVNIKDCHKCFGAELSAMRRKQHVMNKPHLFLVSGLVYFFLQNVHLPERLQAVHAVDEHEPVRHREVVFGEVLSIVEPFGVVKPQLFLHTAVSLHRGHVHVLLCLIGLGTWKTEKTHRGGSSQYTKERTLQSVWLKAASHTPTVWFPYRSCSSMAVFPTAAWPHTTTLQPFPISSL